MPFWLGGEAWNARAKDMFAKRKMLAASGAEDRKHRAEDALACLAEQCADAGGRGNAGVRFPGGGAGVSPRGLPANVHAWSKFMTLSYIRTRKTSCRNAPARATFVLPSCSWKLVWTLSRRSRTVSLCSLSTIIGKVVDNCTLRWCHGPAAAILRSSSGVELQSIVMAIVALPVDTVPDRWRRGSSLPV